MQLDSSPRNSVAPHYLEVTEGIDPQLIELFNLLEQFPLSLQETLSPLLMKGIELIVQRQKEGGVYTSGADRIKAFYSLEGLWPGIPKDTALFRALKAAILLNELGQSALTSQFYEPIQLAGLYLESCRHQQLRPQGRDMFRILGYAFQGDYQRAHGCLEELILAESG